MESPKTIPSINKNKNTYHLFKCFKPDDVVDSPKGKTTDALLSYLSVAEKQGIALPTMLPLSMTASKGGAGDGSKSRRRNLGKDRSHRLREALLAALNHTSLGKKILNRTKANKNKNLWSKSKVRELEGASDRILNTNHKEEPQDTFSYTNNSSSNNSIAFTPSALSSSTCSSRSQGTNILGLSSELILYPNSPIKEVLVEVKQEVVGNGKRYFGLNMGLCLLFLISLLVLVLLGKFCSILCTSIGFFFVHYCRRKWCNERNIIMCEQEEKKEKEKEEIIEFDSARCKKLILRDLSKKELNGERPL